LKQYSNIIFTNGARDPWIAGGVTEFIENLDIATYVMANAENEFDLRMPHDDDYPDVAYVREQEAEIIGQWIADY